MRKFRYDSTQVNFLLLLVLGLHVFVCCEQPSYNIISTRDGNKSQGEQGSMVHQKNVLDEVLLSGVKQRIFPGAVAVGGNEHGILYQGAVGTYAYASDTAIHQHESSIDEKGENNDSVDERYNDIGSSAHRGSKFINRPMRLDTHFDLASVTKVIATTSAIALLYEQGYLRLDDRIVDILQEPSFASGGKDNITVMNCLLHNTGLPGVPTPWFWESSFGCPHNSDNTHYPPEDVSCLEKIYSYLLSETEVVTSPGTAYVYSDMGFMLLQFSVGALVQQYGLVRVEDVLHSPYCSSSSARHGDDGSFHNNNSSSKHRVSPVALTCAFETFVRTKIFHYAQDSGATLSSSSSFSDHGHENSVHTAAATNAALMPNTSYMVQERRNRSYCAPTNNDTEGTACMHVCM